MDNRILVFFLVLIFILVNRKSPFSILESGSKLTISDLANQPFLDFMEWLKGLEPEYFQTPDILNFTLVPLDSKLYNTLPEKAISTFLTLINKKGSYDFRKDSVISKKIYNKERTYIVEISFMAYEKTYNFALQLDINYLVMDNGNYMLMNAKSDTKLIKTDNWVYSDEMEDNFAEVNDLHEANMSLTKPDRPLSNCPYENRNYKSMHGGKDQYGNCEEPLKYKGKPLCYNCKLGLFGPGTLGTCCDEQETPDYHFKGDQFDRRENGKLLKEKGLNWHALGSAFNFVL